MLMDIEEETIKLIVADYFNPTEWVGYQRFKCFCLWNLKNNA